MYMYKHIKAYSYICIPGADPGFQGRGAHLKKNHIFSNFRGARAGCAPLWIRPCIHIHINIDIYYIRLYFTVFLLARSNTRDIPFSNILIIKKQFLCNKKSYCTLVQNQ